MLNVLSAVSLLTDVINSGRLHPDIGSYLTRFTNPKTRNINGKLETWYTKELEKNGKAAADEILESFVKSRFLNEFSQSILPIVRGMRDIAQACPNGEHSMVTEVSSNTTMLLPMARELYPGSMVVSVTMPQYDGFGGAFSQYGEVPLKMVVLGIPAGSKDNPVLCLVFQDPKSEYEFRTVSINLDGTSIDWQFMPVMRKDALLIGLLGTTPEERLVSYGASSGGSSSAYLGFPDSDCYLAKHIGKLGPFLSNIVKNQ